MYLLCPFLLINQISHLLSKVFLKTLGSITFKDAFAVYRSGILPYVVHFDIPCSIYMEWTIRVIPACDAQRHNDHRLTIVSHIAVGVEGGAGQVASQLT